MVFQTDLNHSLRVHTRKQTQGIGVRFDWMICLLALNSDRLWWVLIICGESWSDRLWWVLIICGESWSSVVSWSDHLWWVLIVYGESWSDHLWWVLIVYGESIWSSMVSLDLIICGESDHLWWVLVSLVRLAFSPLMVQIRSVWDCGDEISLLIAFVLSRYTRYSAVCDCLLPQSRKWLKLSRFLWFVINVKSSLDLELPGPIQMVFPVFSFISVQLRHFSF